MRDDGTGGSETPDGLPLTAIDPISLLNGSKLPSFLSSTIDCFAA